MVQGYDWKSKGNRFDRNRRGQLLQAGDRKYVARFHCFQSIVSRQATVPDAPLCHPQLLRELLPGFPEGAVAKYFDAEIRFPGKKRGCLEQQVKRLSGYVWSTPADAESLIG